MTHISKSLSFRGLWYAALGFSVLYFSTTPCLYSYGALMYISGTLTYLLSNIQPWSCFAREPWLHIQLWSFHFSLLSYAPLCLCFYRVFIHFCTAHFSSFQFATLFAFCQRAFTCRYRALTFECWYPTAVQILWQSALAQSCRPSFVFILHKPKSTSDVFCRLGDNSNISFTLEKKNVQ